MSASSSPPRSRLITAFVLLVIGALAAHYTVVWLYLTPTNPLKVHYWKPVNEYIHPFFQQNWQLFAPTPIAENQVMLVKARLRDPRTGKVTETLWTDVTTPINESIHRTRIGPYSKLARPMTGVVEGLGYTDPVAEEIRRYTSRKVMEAWHRQMDVYRRLPEEKRREAQRPPVPRLDTLLKLADHETLQRAQTREMTYRLATAYARQHYAGRGELLEINVRLAVHTFPRFSERAQHDSKGRIDWDRPLGWEKPRTDVALR